MALTAWTCVAVSIDHAAPGPCIRGHLEISEASHQGVHPLEGFDTRAGIPQRADEHLECHAVQADVLIPDAIVYLSSNATVSILMSFGLLLKVAIRGSSVEMELMPCNLISTHR